MSPNNQQMVNWMEQALAHVPGEVETLLVFNLNDRLEQPQDQREEYLATTITNYGLVEQKLYFISRQMYRVKGGCS